MLKNPAGERRLVAYVSPANADIFAVDLALRSSLPFHLIPALFAPISSFPTQRNGEVNSDFQAPFRESLVVSLQALLACQACCCLLPQVQS